MMNRTVRGRRCIFRKQRLVSHKDLISTQLGLNEFDIQVNVSHTVS